jgi:hypothetical protein
VPPHSVCEARQIIMRRGNTRNWAIHLGGTQACKNTALRAGMR